MYSTLRLFSALALLLALTPVSSAQVWEITGESPQTTVEQGGSFEVRGRVTNTTSLTISPDIFFRFEQEGVTVARGIVYEDVLFRGRQSRSTEYQQFVPLDTPPGLYVYTVCVGIFPNTCSSSTSFPKVVTPAPLQAQSPAAADWSVMSATPWTSSEAAAVAAPAEAAVVVAPNPFTGQTTLAFTLEEASQVRLAVYDLLGREVAVLAEGATEAGTHQAVLQANSLAPGVYVYRLVVGGEVQTGRLTLLD